MFLLSLACVVAAVAAQRVFPARCQCITKSNATDQRAPLGTLRSGSTLFANGVSMRVPALKWTLIVDSLGFISGSGSIINPNVILTSAQHFEGPGYSVFDLNLHNWRLYAGEYNISTTDPNEKFYHIRRVVLHPGYNITSLENDIALVITVEPITWNDHTRPVCIPDSAHTYTVGTQCWLPGWGSTSSTGNEEVLNQLMYPILDDSICANHWTDFLPYTEVCAGYENQGKDFCGDDIGSPLVCKDQSGAWYTQGIASSGGDCKKADEPGIFEDVTKYTDWIKKTMEEAGYPYQY